MRLKLLVLGFMLACGAVPSAAEAIASSPAKPVPEKSPPALAPAVRCAKPDALGTARDIAIDVGKAPIHVGLKSYPQTLRLADHEVVLTFDDGPNKVTTPEVLDALREQCVRATFFLIGRNAATNARLVRREIAEGHTVGHHSNTHPFFTLRGFDDASAKADIEAGISEVEKAGYDHPAPPSHPHVPFFRFPGFADTPSLVAYLDAQKIAVFGTDLWASDWLKMTPEYEREHVIALLERAPHHSGIILFHDTKASTAAMLPAFLRELREKHYRVVHLGVGDGGAPTELTLPLVPFSSETDRIIAHLWPPIVPGAHHSAATLPDQDPTPPDGDGAETMPDTRP